jgi:hypothetical protein
MINTHQESQDALGLTRRRILKATVIGAGLVTLNGLTGCTEFLSRKPEESGRVANLEAQGAKLDRDLLQATLQQWRKVARVHNGLETTTASQLAEWEDIARQMTFRLLDQVDTSGLAAEINRGLADLPEEVTFPRRLTSQFIARLKDVLRPEQVKVLDEELSKPARKSKVVDPLLKEGGVSAQLRKLLSSAEPQTNSLGAVKALGCPSNSVGICAFAFIVALTFCAFDYDCSVSAGVASAVCLTALLAGGCIQP